MGKHYTDRDRHDMVKKYRQSNLGLSEFARQEHINRSTIKDWVSAYNHLVYRNGTAGFTYDLINATLVEGWLVPFKITIQYNLLNAIFSIINFAGGNWSSGAAGAVRPASLPRLAYA